MREGLHLMLRLAVFFDLNNEISWISSLAWVAIAAFSASSLLARSGFSCSPLWADPRR